MYEINDGRLTRFGKAVACYLTTMASGPVPCGPGCAAFEFRPKKTEKQQSEVVLHCCKRGIKLGRK